MKNMKGDFFHILNRGVEKRKIFLDDEDRMRFVYNLFDFNDKNLVLNSYFNRRVSAMRKPKSDELVDVLCWCLMPNHYHILVREKLDGGASAFSKKITSGYTQYFNLKNKREGVLFQGRSKIILIQQDAHFLHLPYYIFSNPVKLIEPRWKDVGVNNTTIIMNFLEKYYWSSFLDAIGKGKFIKTINKKLFLDVFQTSEKDFQKSFLVWLNSAMR